MNPTMQKDNTWPQNVFSPDIQGWLTNRKSVNAIHHVNRINIYQDQLMQKKSIWQSFIPIPDKNS